MSMNVVIGTSLLLNACHRCHMRVKSNYVESYVNRYLICFHIFGTAENRFGEKYWKNLLLDRQWRWTLLFKRSTAEADREFGHVNLWSWIFHTQSSIFDQRKISQFLVLVGSGPWSVIYLYCAGGRRLYHLFCVLLSIRFGRADQTETVADHHTVQLSEGVRIFIDINVFVVWTLASISDSVLIIVELNVETCK